MLSTIALTGLAVALLPWQAGAQEGQDASPGTPGGYLGLSFQVGQAKGQFAEYVDYGFGGGAYLVFRPGRRGPLGVRLDVMYLNYGSQRHSHPLVPGIVVDVTTDNDIFQIALGPQLLIGRGALRVYGFGTVGVSGFMTTSAVEGTDQNNQQFASTTNHADATFSGEGGGGLLVRLGGGLLLDVGARYLKNGRVTYVTKERVTITGNQLIVDPVHSDANLMIYHLGIAIGRH